MSYVTFHSPSGNLELFGSAMRRVEDLAVHVFTTALGEPACAALQRWMPWEAQALPSLRARDLNTTIRMDDQEINLFTVALDTLRRHEPAASALVDLYTGSWNYGWVDGPDRGWLADKFQRLLDIGMATPGIAERHRASVEIAGPTLPPDTRAGWEETVAFLRSRADEPVVVTYSFDGDRFFPATAEDLARDAAMWHDDSEPDEDTGETAWDRLAPTVQWDLGVRALRHLEATWPRQWTPHRHTVLGPTVYDLADAATQAQTTC